MGGIELNECEKEVNRIRPQNRDGYDIHVDYLRVEGFVSLDEASSAVNNHGRRRQLTLSELLHLNLNDPNIRSVWPVFSGDFVLESLPIDYDEVSDTSQKKWALRLSALHRGIVLDRDSIFATTMLTKVDLGEFDEKFLEPLVSSPDKGPYFLK
jgi:hypothetical protein